MIAPPIFCCQPNKEIIVSEYHFVPVDYGADPSSQCRNNHGEICGDLLIDERVSLSLLFAKVLRTDDRDCFIRIVTFPAALLVSLLSPTSHFAQCRPSSF